VGLRGRIVLTAASGQADSAIARRWETNRKTVVLWRARFAKHGLHSLWEVAPGRGRKPTYETKKINAIVAATLHTKPKGMTHWSGRLMAESQGVSTSPRSTTSGAVTISSRTGSSGLSCRAIPGFWRS
jgi:transposase